VPVDVLTSIDIACPRDVVASFSSNPDNAPIWYVNIKSVKWRVGAQLSPGSRVAFVARFLGRSLEYTYQVAAFEPNVRLVMSTTEGPFPMETTYTWRTIAGGTRMTLRNTGQPDGLLSLVAPLVAGAMRRANKKDLARLKAILETKRSRASQ